MQISGKKGFAACVLAAAFVVLTALSAACEAAVQTIEATGVYVMGDNDSPKIARDAARQEAMRVAVEKAGLYVESYSKTQNMQLTEDEVRTISGAVLKVTKEEAIPELKGSTLKYTVNLTAEVDTDQINLQEMMKNKTEEQKYNPTELQGIPFKVIATYISMMQ